MMEKHWTACRIGPAISTYSLTQNEAWMKQHNNRREIRLETTTPPEVNSLLFFCISCRCPFFSVVLLSFLLLSLLSTLLVVAVCKITNTHSLIHSLTGAWQGDLFDADSLHSPHFFPTPLPLLPPLRLHNAPQRCRASACISPPAPSKPCCDRCWPGAAATGCSWPCCWPRRWSTSCTPTTRPT